MYAGLIIGEVKEIIHPKGSIVALKINAKFVDILNKNLRFSVVKSELLLDDDYVKVERYLGLDNIKKVTYNNSNRKGIVELIDIFDIILLISYTIESSLR